MVHRLKLEPGWAHFRWNLSSTYDEQARAYPDIFALAEMTTAPRLAGSWADDWSVELAPEPEGDEIEGPIPDKPIGDWYYLISTMPGVLVVLNDRAWEVLQPFLTEEDEVLSAWFEEEHIRLVHPRNIAKLNQVGGRDMIREFPDSHLLYIGEDIVSAIREAGLKGLDFEEVEDS